MARRRVPVLPAGVEAFERTADQWRELEAPSWVFDLDAAAQAYVTWGRLGYGGGGDPDDPIERHYARSWMARCVKPQYLVRCPTSRRSCWSVAGGRSGAVRDAARHRCWTRPRTCRRGWGAAGRSRAVARRKQPPGPVAALVELPAELSRESVTVERFVSWSQRPPWYWADTDGPQYRDWRRIRALRRWQDSVQEWGTEHGLDRRALTTLGY